MGSDHGAHVHISLFDRARNAEGRVKELEAKLAETQERGLRGNEALTRCEDKLAEKQADSDRLRARVALAMEATECCTSCVRTWLLGELDEEQEQRVRSAISAARAKEK